MTRSLALKWIVTLLATSLIGVGLVALFAYRATSSEFDRLRFVQLENEFSSIASAYYETHGTWEGFDQWLLETNPAPPPPPVPMRVPYPMFALVNTEGEVVRSAGPFEDGETVSPQALNDATSVEVGDAIVAALIPAGPPQPPNSEEERYLERIGSAVLIGALGAVSAALVVGILLSRHIMRPLNELTDAIRAMRQGQLEQRIPVRTRDELGELIEAFNQMSSELHRSNDLRRQMTADIAHELRTPLTVITGYLEGLRNGTLRPTSQRLEVLHNEALHLNHLVEDLRTLSLADAGELRLRRETVGPRELLRRTAASFEAAAERQDIDIVVDAMESLPEIDVDPDRMAQVLANLVGNALRYAPGGTSVTLSAYMADGCIEIRVTDQGRGIPADKLANVFERFYRVDGSRSEQGSESGLGLAIAKSIVEAHGGTVHAQSREGQGTTMIVRLPFRREGEAAPGVSR